MSAVDYINKTVEYEALAEAIYDADVQFEDMDSVIYRDYSGRAMYGSTCFGLVLDSDQDMVRVLIELANPRLEDDPDRKDAVIELTRSLRADSMGYSGIWYFPGWTLANAPDVEDEE
jgi:hypothetical protein